MRKLGNMMFMADPHRYHISQIGAACLFDVSENRRGFFKPFRGQRVRMVCIGSGRYKRVYMANKVNF